jgi:lipopolysaccharide transport system ATP-binding protein
MPAPTLRAENLGKAYRTYRRPIDSLKELLLGRDYAETFWALRGVTLSMAKGGSLGIVGDNGAGKTTLLKLLAGASMPTEGSLQRTGRLSAILSLGAGFHPDLSGTENIRIGCAVMGLSPAQTDEVLPRIIDFSELGSFIDRPVKTYSSGMYLRLGFSVATVSGPDLLIVDEHLSVGDQHFRHKCMRRIMELRESGCSLVFCSHDLHSIGEVCERTLWMRDGRPAMLGPTEDVLKVYQDHVRARDAGPAEIEAVRRETSRPTVLDQANRLVVVALHGTDRDGVLNTGDTLELSLSAEVSEAAARDGVHIALIIVRNDSVWCYGTTSRMEGGHNMRRQPGGQFGIRFVLEELALLSGRYTFTVALMDDASPHCYDYQLGVAPFTVRHDTKEAGVVRLRHQWLDPVP